MADLPFSSTQLLAGVASALLLFVSLGVVYLSTVEWRDRRRRRRDSSAAPLKPGARSKAAKSASSGKAGNSANAGNGSKAGKGAKTSSGIRAGRRSSSSGSPPRS